MGAGSTGLVDVELVGRVDAHVHYVRKKTTDPAEPCSTDQSAVRQARNALI